MLDPNFYPSNSLVFFTMHITALQSMIITLLTYYWIHVASLSLLMKWEH